MGKLKQFEIYKYILLLVFLCKGFAVLAQPKEVLKQHLIWFNYNNNIQLFPHWFWITEVFERRFIDEFKHHHLLLRGHIHYKFNHGFDVGGGFTYSLQSAQTVESKSTLAVPELRPHLEINHKYHGHKINLTNRIKIEDRFFRNTLNEELVNGYQSNFRFRYFILVDVELVKFKNEQVLKFKLSDEIHVDAGNQIKFGTFDQNRIYAGISVDVHPKLAIELGYLNWYQKRSSGYQYYNRNILKLSINHKINLIPKNKPPN